jgi:hypothetical protein
MEKLEMRRGWTAPCITASLGALVISLAPIAGGQEADQAEDTHCGWSEAWTNLSAKFSPIPPGARITDSKRVKGSIKRPRSGETHLIRGTWLVEAVIDDRGKVRDAKIVTAPHMEPPWPEYEEAIIESILKWRYKPVRVDGKPWPNCTSITINER